MKKLTLLVEETAHTNGTKVRVFIRGTKSEFSTSSEVILTGCHRFEITHINKKLHSIHVTKISTYRIFKNESNDVRVLRMREVEELDRLLTSESVIV